MSGQITLGYNSNQCRIFERNGRQIFEKIFPLAHRNRWANEVATYQFLHSKRADYLPSLIAHGHTPDGRLFLHIAAVERANDSLDPKYRASAVGSLMRKLHSLPTMNFTGVPMSSQDSWLKDMDRSSSLLQQLGMTPSQISALRYLLKKMESPKIVSLLHRDLRWDNLIFSTQGLMLIDWEMVALGPAPLDLVRFYWTELPDELSRSFFLQAYQPNWKTDLLQDMKACFLVEMGAYFAAQSTITEENRNYMRPLIEHVQRRLGC